MVVRFTSACGRIYELSLQGVVNNAKKLSGWVVNGAYDMLHDKATSLTFFRDGRSIIKQFKATYEIVSR